MSEPRNIYSPRIAVISPPSTERAQQQFKEDCDINTIMRRIQKGGATDHIAKYQPEYGFATPLSYHESLNIVRRADSMFNDLPSEIRNEFSNNPEAFLEFVQNPDNAQRAKELGIELSDQAKAIAESTPPEALGEPIAVEGAPMAAGAAEAPEATP